MKHFDPSILLERLEEDQELFQEIMDVFMEDVPRQIETLKTALKDKDPAMLEHQAHTLKGASGNVGAIAIHDLALQMETIGRNGDISKLDGLEDTIKQIDAEFEEIREHLKRSNTM